MYSELMMLIAFLLLTGIAMIFYTLLKMSSVESMVLSTLAVVFVMFFSGKIHAFQVGIGISCIMAVLGVVLFVVRCHCRQQFFSPGFVGLGCLYLLSMLAFHGDFLHNIDDFHQWAAAVKYMYTNNAIPAGEDFLGSVNLPMETGAFHAFFQYLGGYNEGHMYVSAFFLNAVGIMLPAAHMSWKNWKNVLLYTLLVYVGLFSLYVHPYKSLYVDLPTAAWAGGLCLWWSASFRSDTRSLPKILIVLMPSLYFLIRIKWGVGLLLAGCVILYMLMDYVICSGRQQVLQYFKQHYKKIAIICIVLVVLFGVSYMLLGSRLIPGSFSGILEALTISSQKARTTLHQLLINVFRTNLSTFSELHLTAFICAVAFPLGMIELSRLVSNKYKTLCKASGVFSLLCFIGYMGALYVTYVSTFSYDESVRNAAHHRYFSIIIVFMFIIFCGLLLVGVDEISAGRLRTVSVVALLFFMLGIGDQFLAKATAYDAKSVNGYSSIRQTKKELKAIDEIIDEEDRVYLLVQDNSLAELDEFPMSVALYYDAEHISNYLRMPWKFQEGGSLLFVRNDDTDIYDFEDILRDGDYTYIWVYSTDDYLGEQFKQLFNYEEEVREGLYRINWKDREIEGIDYVSALK